LISIEHPPEELLKKCFRTSQRHSKHVAGTILGTQEALARLLAAGNVKDFSASCLEKEKT
jgi:hypothetical protein